MTTCQDCDYAHPKRLGRAHYVCPKCGRDLTLELVLIAECLEKEKR